MLNEHQQLQGLIRTGNLKKHEANKVWKLMHEQGFAAAQAYIDSIKTPVSAAQTEIRPQPIPYKVWGAEQIEEGAHEQMRNSARLPITLAGALMPDAHQGYGLPIGGVLATDNVVIPYAVGVDIACRMMLTVYPYEPGLFNRPNKRERLQKALIDNTIFGAGAAGLRDDKIEHPLLDYSRWSDLPILRELRQTGIAQIGTSGTGNHFVEWCEFNVTQPNNPLGLEPGTYLALLSHSGSRGVGYKIATYYSELAMSLMPDLPEGVKHLAWLPLDSEAGQEYWLAMHLAGEFASANHHVIHERVARAAGLEPIATVENHHNFAWRETIKIDGEKREAIVHRKGATPAGAGVLGIIPGSMGDAGYVISGKGSNAALNSASHGAGRRMSRNKARQTITPQQQKDYLKKSGVTLIGGGLDESPQAYKRIEDVIAAQADLVQIIGRLQPRIVRMADDSKHCKKQPVPRGIVDAEGD